MNNVTVEILMGLPGSGKTMFAKTERKTAKVIDCDKYPKFHTDIQEYSKRAIFRALANGPQINSAVVVLDGLFLTNEDLINAVAGIIKGVQQCVNYQLTKVVIHHWNEDRNTCLKNHKGHGNHAVLSMIKTASYERPDATVIKVKTQLTAPLVVKRHTVEPKPDWEHFLNQYINVADTNILKSSEWFCGGVSGNLDGTTSLIEAESECDFDDLDELLEHICPQLPFPQYKKIFRQVAHQKERIEDGYYGSVSYYRWWECNLYELYNTLLEYGIPEEEK